VPEPAELRCWNIALARGRHVLFRDLSFAIAQGETLSVEGPNGSGKTSLLRLIAGFLPPLVGSLTVVTTAGDEVTDADERGNLVGWLGHQDGLKPQLTPSETLRFFSRYHGTRRDVEAILAMVGLGRVRNLPVSYLSAGQRRRLALARLSLLERPLWLLDEPLSALDLQGRGLVSELVSAHCAKGGLAIAATHEPLGITCRRITLGTV
jgi:heme exporter protein A